MRHIAVVVCLFILAGPLAAATFDLPSDRQLLDRADLVVVATVLGSSTRAASDGMILTDYQLRVDDVLKGGAPTTIVVSEPGGLFKGRGVEIAGSAVYHTGTRVLAFLRQRPDGTYYTAFMGLGKYRFAKDLLVRDPDGIETLSGDPADVRKATAFIEVIRSGAPTRAPRIAVQSRPDPEPRTEAVASAYVLTVGGPKRWKDCENPCTIGFTVNNGAHPVADSIGGLEDAYAAWTNHTNSFVNLETDNIGSDMVRTNDDENDVVLNWTGDDPHSTCEFAKGCGIVYFNGPPFTHTFRGETFNDVIAADVLVHQSINTQTAYETILTHELGHALAFRHSDAGTPSSSSGLMRSSVPTSIGPILGPWEQEALTAVYGPGVACVPITITTTSGGGTVTSGSTKTLSVTVTGDSPRTYQWYEGLSGDTTTLVGTNSPNFVTPPITETKNYWVRVSNGCSPAANSATITVSPATCNGANFTSVPSSRQIPSGATTTLNVVANGTSPLTFRWYQANTVGNTATQVATLPAFTTPPLTETTSYWARVSNQCGQDDTPLITLSIGSQCGSLDVPMVSAPALAHFSTGYNVSWTGDGTVGTFEVQEATNAVFTENLQTFTVASSLSLAIAPHVGITTDTRFHYRVRAISACNSQPTAWSEMMSTVVTAPLPATSTQFAFSVPAGSGQTFTQDLLVPGFGETATSGDTFSITIDVPWITIFPPNGALSAGGTTVQLTVNPAGLDIGSVMGTITIVRTPGAAGKGIATNDGPATTGLPLSLSLVTPVSPDPRHGEPPPGTMIVPAVAHTQGVENPFLSDIRIVNVSFANLEYDISFTPTEVNGAEHGKKTTLTIGSGEVIALNDVVSGWFGAGMLGETGIGTIEIRPRGAANEFDTFASSRTYALDGGGTLGQFIPALRLNQFIGTIAEDSLARISLQQVANTSAYRTNVGFVEGTGSPVTFTARLVDQNNTLIQSIQRDLPPYGHEQQNLTDYFGNTPVPNGRIEVEVVSPGGKVSAYASVVNNTTDDPLLVFPVQPARTTAERYVLAGIAEIVATDRNFHSDLRLYNAGDAPVTATFRYYDRGATAPLPGAPAVQRTVQAGQIIAIDDVLPTLWPGLTGGGSVVITTAGPSSLVATAQTYSRQLDGGTKGQFIPGVTFREGTGLGDRPLEVLQLEQSTLYRSNVGFVEVTGKPVVVEITAYNPDAKTSVLTNIALQPNEYRQFDRLLSSMGLGTVYNGRVSVKVIDGEGRVYAYGSTIDNRTEDPTYVPAQ